MDLEKFRIGLVFRNHDIIVLGEYKDDGTMDENTMGVISDDTGIYKDLPLNKFEVVGVERNSDDEISLKDYHSYTIGEEQGVESVIGIYRDDPEEFFNIITDLYEPILDEIAH